MVLYIRDRSLTTWILPKCESVADHHASHLLQRKAGNPGKEVRIGEASRKDDLYPP